MKNIVDVAVSTDPIQDFQNIVEYAKEMQGVADFLHCDIMNENFVKKNTFDYNVVKTINSASAIMLDCHLMVDEPANSVSKYIDAGANIVTVHYEAFYDKNTLAEVLRYIRSRNTLAGISLKPATPFKEIRAFAYNADVVLVMGVEPGASYQETSEETYKKVAEINKFKKDNNLNFKIEFDGGVNEKNAQLFMDLGIKDSKKISDKKILELEKHIKANAVHSIVAISNQRYNELYSNIKNLNKLLAWGHARVIENIAEKHECEYALSDKFGDENLIKSALMKNGRNIRLEQMVRAESDVAVAAASVLARAAFVQKIKAMEDTYGITFPKGCAPQVKTAAKEFIDKYGKDRLHEVCKTHFKTYNEV